MADATTESPSGGARQLERVAIEVASEAANHVRDSASADMTAERTKSTATDVVTRVDVESENLIRAELRARCPGSTIVGEELEREDGASNVAWIVDPIDGTVNFLYDLPVVSVSIAATVDGVVVAGAVADVHRGETFAAAKGGGARCDGRSVAATDQSDLTQSLVGTGFAYSSELRAQQAEVILRLLPSCRDIRCMGSAALNLCWVASGRLDGYFERDLKPYDYAAGLLIAAEGGATVQHPSTNGLDLTVAAGAGIAASLDAIVLGATGSHQRVE